MILDEIAEFLQARQQGTIGEDLYTAGFPDNATVPDDAVAIYEYPGAPPLHTKGVPTPALRRPRIQVVCRSKSYPRARAKAEGLFALLSGLSGELSVRAIGEPFPLDRDAAQRSRIACNYEATQIS